jgi:hypothetical protein
LAVRTGRSQRLAMGAVEHGLFSFPGIMAIRAGPTVRGTSHGSSGCPGSIDGVGGNEGSLRRDRVEQTLLVEPHTVLATAVRRTVISRAPNLATISGESSKRLSDFRRTLRLRQYLQAMAVRCLGAAAGGGGYPCGGG